MAEHDCFQLERVVSSIAAAIRAGQAQVRAAIELLEAGNTIPFIARYRKEATQGLDETALRAIEDALAKAHELASRKATILKSIAQQGQLTDELRGRLDACDDKQLLEDLYLPYKPKRRTRATIARDRGLEPLAEILLRQETLGRPRAEIVRPFICAEQEVPDAEAAVQGACDIVAEVWADDVANRTLLQQEARLGRITSAVKRGKKDDDSKFASYFDHQELIAKIPSHRFLAMKRGEDEGVLRLAIQVDGEAVVRKLTRRLLTNDRFEFRDDLLRTVQDCYERLLLPATETTVMNQLKEVADAEAIDVFARNLRELLLAPPAGPKVTMGIDPGFRTGCKVAVVDATGKFLETATIYPTAPQQDVAGATATLKQLIARHDVQLIAIGNGTASRETDAFVSDLLRHHKLDIAKVVVSEAGASVYSASEAAVAEYPELDVTVRGAISIAHRLQDPLAELVKIDPKSIGVGQYQHDVNQTQLKKSLDREVESCVNSVGVDLNMASGSLLSYVAGIGPKLADRIIQFRNAKGRFASRQELLEVPKLGPKVFEQAAGFLRIRNGSQPLDNSAVHPESYHIVQKMAASLGTTTDQLVGNSTLSTRLNPQQFVGPQCGLPTIQDIIAELAKPGRDPRSQFRVARFADGVSELTDLKPGMILEGSVTNVTRFGAFVDVGVHQDGLVHISELANSYVNDPSEVVSVGQIVRVKVLEVDLSRRRIALSRKQA